MYVHAASAFDYVGSGSFVGVEGLDGTIAYALAGLARHVREETFIRFGEGKSEEEVNVFVDGARYSIDRSINSLLSAK